MNTCIRDLQEVTSLPYSDSHMMRAQQSNRILNWQIHTNRLKKIEAQLMEAQHAARMQKQINQQEQYEAMKRTQTKLRDVHLQNFLKKQIATEQVKKIMHHKQVLPEEVALHETRSVDTIPRPKHDWTHAYSSPEPHRHSRNISGVGQSAYTMSIDDDLSGL